jgi:KH domain-containing protein
MEEIYIGNIRKIIQNKETLEEQLEIEISNRGKNVFVKGNAEKEFVALKVLKALDLGFSLECAFQLKKEEILFQRLNIKELTKRKDLERIRARVIGTHRKTLNCLEKLTNCSICLKDNDIGIIGDSEEIEDALQAITSIVQGSKQGNVYARLEKQRKRKRIKEKVNIKNELD